LAVVDQHLTGEEIRTNCGLVACAELFVDLELMMGSVSLTEEAPSAAYILVHQARLADTAIAQDDDLILPKILAQSRHNKVAQPCSAHSVP